MARYAALYVLCAAGCRCIELFVSVSGGRGATSFTSDSCFAGAGALEWAHEAWTRLRDAACTAEAEAQVVGGAATAGSAASATDAAAAKLAREQVTIK